MKDIILVSPIIIVFVVGFSSTWAGSIHKELNKKNKTCDIRFHIFYHDVTYIAAV